MATIASASTARMKKHLDTLCVQIGERFAGTPGEHAAAQYITHQFQQSGLSDACSVPFQFPNWNFSRCSVRCEKDSVIARVSSGRPVVYSVSTPKEGVAGPLAYLEDGARWNFDQPLRGRIGLLIGSLALSDTDIKKRLNKSGLRAVLTVDARLPFSWTTSNGASPAWVDDYRLPTAGISFMDAVRLVESMPARVRVQIKAASFPAMSQNVIAQIPGGRHADDVIVVSAHHDSVGGNVGADDNASGVTAVLELARIFARRRPKRTLRFISYGVEERLSVGSYLHMRSLRPADRKRIAFCLNFDTISSPVGTDKANITGDAALGRLVADLWNRRRHPVTVQDDLCPYADQFPMNMIGVPSVYLTRPSIAGDSYWTLHSTHDGLDHVSPAILKRTIGSAAVLLDRVANADRLPFRRRLAPEIMRGVRRVARSEFKHPWNPNRFDYSR